MAVTRQLEIKTNQEECFLVTVLYENVHLQKIKNDRSYDTESFSFKTTDIRDLYSFVLEELKRQKENQNG